MSVSIPRHHKTSASAMAGIIKELRLWEERGLLRFTLMPAAKTKAARDVGEGFPNLVVCPSIISIIIFLETRQPRRLLKKAQRQWHDYLRGLGHPVGVVQTADEMLDFIAPFFRIGPL